MMPRAPLTFRQCDVTTVGGRAVVYNLDQAARRLHKSRRWLQDFIRDHPYYRLAGRTKLFTELDILKLIERATGAWIDCPVGTTAREKAQPPKTRVQEVASDQEGLRTFVVDSEERRDYEQAIRPEYLAQLNELYESWAQQFTLCPILTVPADNLNYVLHDAHLDLIVGKIREKLSGNEEVRFDAEEVAKLNQV